jgi:hypothetical protein
MSLVTLFLIIALVLFIVAAIGVSSRINLVAAGLAFCVLSVLIPAIA